MTVTTEGTADPRGNFKRSVLETPPSVAVLFRQRTCAPATGGTSALSKQQKICGFRLFLNVLMTIPDNKESLIQAAEIIRSGGVIAFRTDTFYGLGADPFNRDAIVRIRELKGREDDKPILLLVSDESEVDRFIEQSEFFRLIAKGHWPAPPTLISVA